MGTAVVTGAAGHQVHLADTDDTADLAAEVGGVAHVVDVSIPQDLERLGFAAADAEVVCLNAGVVNGLGAFVPRTPDRDASGRLVATGSLACLVSFPGDGAYGHPARPRRGGRAGRTGAAGHAGDGDAAGR